MQLSVHLALTLCIGHGGLMSDTDPTAPSIYKIFTPEDWEALEEMGESLGSAHDRSDGFLHFSTQAQLTGTLHVHYATAGALILARVKTDQLKPSALLWEPSRNGALFPHLYGTLKRSQIDQVWPLSRNDQGAYALPEDL